MELADIAQELVDFSLDAETRDNVTVLLAQLGLDGQGQEVSEAEAE
jgi:serine/threonine protein phosphatase PrpC